MRCHNGGRSAKLGVVVFTGSNAQFVGGVAFQPYKLPILTSQLCPAHRATPRYDVTALPDLSTEDHFLFLLTFR